MGSGNNPIFNIISIVCLILSFGVIVFVGIRMTQPPIPRQSDVSVLPTPFQFPTNTPSPIVPTLPATFTPTITNTPTPTNTDTSTPVPLPTATITETPGPTLTPSDTPTPSVSPTFTPTATPTGPTNTPVTPPNPYPFELYGGAVEFRANFAAPAAGCLWQGIGGRVRGLDGMEITGFNILVYNAANTFSQTVPAGSNTNYGSISGWEVRVGDAISTDTYFVQLFTAATNTRVSDVVQVTFPASCNGNLAYLDFIRVR